MSTIKDVAEAAGVSITTVSHVVNGTRRVSDTLSRRVLDAMERLDYRPNGVARSLRLGHTKTLGLITPDNSNPFFAEMARTIEDIGYQYGYSVILCNSDDDVRKQRAYIRVLIDKHVDGVIFISSAGSESGDDVHYLTDEGVKVVIVDRDDDSVPADAVLLNNEQAGYEATRHLLNLNHRRIACITGPTGLAASEQRVEGYRRALHEAGIAFDPTYVAVGDFHMESGEKAIARLLAVTPRPTAIFACNDMMAIGAMYQTRGLGLRIPEDLSIIGFDDITLARAVYPALSTMRHPKAEMARIATEFLIQRIQGQVPGEERLRVVLFAQLVSRDSCAPYNESAHRSVRSSSA